METVCFCTFLSGPQAKLMCTVPHDCSDLLSPLTLDWVSSS